jgi:hypothetical protein
MISGAAEGKVQKNGHGSIWKIALILSSFNAEIGTEVTMILS